MSVNSEALTASINKLTAQITLLPANVAAAVAAVTTPVSDPADAAAMAAAVTAVDAATAIAAQANTDLSQFVPTVNT